jgi:hypothetical protein
LGWSDCQATSTRTDFTPAAAIFAITASRLESEYCFQVQWNSTPTAGASAGFAVCVAAPAVAAAQQNSATMGAMRRLIAE